MRSLVKVIREISSGNFDPDLTKSGLLARERRGSGGVELSESEGSKEDEHPVGSFECKAQIYESHLYDLLQALVTLVLELLSLCLCRAERRSLGAAPKVNGEIQRLPASAKVASGFSLG